MFKKIFLDMDGVIVDFIGGVLKKYGLNQLSNPTEWDFNYREDFGCSCADFWEGLTDEFWRDLEFTKEAVDIFELFHSRDLMDRVCLFSKPPGDIGFKGKAQFIKNNLRQMYNEGQFMLGFNKNWCARPDALLIDDNESNCREFEKAGGKSFLFPRPWNICRDLEPISVQELEDFIDAIGLRGPNAWKGGRNKWAV